MQGKKDAKSIGPFLVSGSRDRVINIWDVTAGVCLIKLVSPRVSVCVTVCMCVCLCVCLSQCVCVWPVLCMLTLVYNCVYKREVCV